MAGARHPPDRPPTQRPPHAGRLGKPDLIAAQCFPPGGTRPKPDRRHPRPRQEVERTYRRRKVAPGKPDTVSGLKAVELGVPSRLDCRVIDLDLPVVANVESAVPNPPGQFDAFMRIPKRRWPAARELEGIATDGNRAFPDVHRRATAGRVANTYPWSPAPWRGSARWVDDTRLNHAERRICSELRRHPRQDVVLREAGIVVEEEQQVSLDQAHSGVATSGNAQILR